MGPGPLISDPRTRIALVGCGYVADFYLATLADHPELELVGVFDRDPERADRFASAHQLPRYRALDQLLTDDQVTIVVNLTNPRSHYQVSAAALTAGKHVYSEKPLSTDLPEARSLVDMAEDRDLLLACAPCNVLGESAQTLWKALRDGRVGVPRLVYAELDDGPVPLKNYGQWTSQSGTPWPAKDEFETGCTLEHAGYYLTWLTAFFGPATHITSSTQVLLADKGTPLDVSAPDFAVSCLEFASGVTARLTCSIYASEDRGIRIFGDEGVLAVRDCWDYGSPVYLSRRNRLGLRLEGHPTLAKLTGLGNRRLPLVRKVEFTNDVRGANRMDYCRGIEDLARAVRAGDQPRLGARWALHVNELVLAMQTPAPSVARYRMASTFDPMPPMAWSI